VFLVHWLAVTLTRINGPSRAAVPVVFDAGGKTNECVPTGRMQCLVNMSPRDRLIQSDVILPQ